MLVSSSPINARTVMSSVQYNGGKPSRAGYYVYVKDNNENKYYYSSSNYEKNTYEYNVFYVLYYDGNNRTYTNDLAQESLNGVKPAFMWVDYESYIAGNRVQNGNLVLLDGDTGLDELYVCLKEGNVGRYSANRYTDNNSTIGFYKQMINGVCSDQENFSGLNIVQKLNGNYNINIQKYNEMVDESVINSNNITSYDALNLMQTSTTSSAGTSNLDWWNGARDFFQIGKTDNPTDISNRALDGLEELVFGIGNIIFFIVTAALGVKYIWGGAESKFSVKNSMINLIVAAMVFYGWDAIANVLDVQNILSTSSSEMAFATKIYDTIMYIVNLAAIGGIIYIGVRYMMAGADGKAELKLKFIPIIFGVIMVYGTLNLIQFILKFVPGA